ncbi:MAG: CoA transferase [Chloroflexi bacterium]|nr:CoA transferase [Chloroflexota bacterium]
MERSSPGPLAGITVLEFGHILAGPFCTMLLADLGATVIKIEKPGSGDAARRLGQKLEGGSVYFTGINRGKKSVALDISREEGRQLAESMAAQSDVLVENFQPGTMEKLGLGYARLSRANLRLVYASISGFGQDGPSSRLPSYDIIVQALGGLMSLTGEADGPPTRTGISLGDSAAGLFAALAIVSALRHAGKEGQGSYIDMSMLDCQVTLAENAFSRYFAGGEVPKRIGSRHPDAVPFQRFATRDGYIVVALVTDDARGWRSFCLAIGHGELAEDPRFRDGRGRSENYRVLGPVMENAISSRASGEWLETFSRLGIACAPVHDIAQAAADPQVRHRGMIAEVPAKGGGVHRVANTPFKISGNTCGPRGGPPGLGEHTAEVLRGMLGMSESDLEALRRKGIS